MGNLWGIANPGSIPVLTGVGGDVTLTAGVETTYATTAALVAPSPGDYFPVLWGFIVVTFGAALPTALTFRWNIGGGSAVSSSGISPLLMVANATSLFPVLFFGVNSATAWIGAGSVINLTGISTTNACTVKATYTAIYALLFRGPDA